MDSDNPVLRFPDDRDILFSGYNGFKNCVYACDNTPIYIFNKYDIHTRKFQCIMYAV